MKEVLKNGYFWLILFIVIAIFIYGCKNGLFEKIFHGGGVISGRPRTSDSLRNFVHQLPMSNCAKDEVSFIGACIPDWKRDQFITYILSGYSDKMNEASIGNLSDEQLQSMYLGIRDNKIVNTNNNNWAKEQCMAGCTNYNPNDKNSCDQLCKTI